MLFAETLTEHQLVKSDHWCSLKDQNVSTLFPFMLNSNPSMNTSITVLKSGIELLGILD